jgi:hypothetical protein
MIVFDLVCGSGAHRFEGWFGSSTDFDDQQERDLVTCPQCGSTDIIKAPMAPNVGRKANQVAASRSPGPPSGLAPSGNVPVASGPLPPQAVAMIQVMAVMQAEALKQSRWVGDGFAEVTREIHYGEREAETIHGQATIKQALELVEEGIEVMPLPFPVAPPGEAN